VADPVRRREEPGQPWALPAHLRRRARRDTRTEAVGSPEPTAHIRQGRGIVAGAVIPHDPQLRGEVAGTPVGVARGELTGTPEEDALMARILPP